TGDGKIGGVCASPGLAVGPVAHYAVEIGPVEKQGRGLAEERAALAEARRAVDARLAVQPGEIAEAHRGLLDDPELAAAAEAGIAAGRSAAFALRAAVEEVAARLSATGNALLIERVD